MRRMNPRRWLPRRTQAPNETEQFGAQDAGHAVREARAALVVTLRAEVRHLQQEIVDLTKSWENGTDQSDRQDATARLRSIEQALTLKQAELSRLQGRV